MKTLLQIITVAAIMAATLCGCGSDEYNDSMTLYDLVTFERNTSKAAVFSMQKNGDSPLIELTAQGRNVDTTQVKPGQRLMMAYIPESGEPYTSGDITLRGLSLIHYNKITIGKTDNWNASKVYMNSMWRTGVYLNLECRIDYTDREERRFLLVADESTANDAIPQLYVVHDMGGLPDNFTRRTYASWNMAEIWNRPGCRGVTVHINDSNRGITSMTFNKQDN